MNISSLDRLTTRLHGTALWLCMAALLKIPRILTFGAAHLKSDVLQIRGLRSRPVNTSNSTRSGNEGHVNDQVLDLSPENIRSSIVVMNQHNPRLCISTRGLTYPYASFPLDPYGLASIIPRPPDNKEEHE